MLENYFPILIFLVLGVFFGVAPLLAGWVVAPNHPDSAKLSPSEMF